MDSFVGGFVGALIAGRRRRRDSGTSSDFGDLLTKANVRYVSGDPARPKSAGLLGARNLEIRTRAIVERHGRNVDSVLDAASVHSAWVVEQPRSGRPIQLLNIAVVEGSGEHRTLRYHVASARAKADADACVRAIDTMRGRTQPARSVEVGALNHHGNCSVGS